MTPTAILSPPTDADCGCDDRAQEFGSIDTQLCRRLHFRAAIDETHDLASFDYELPAELEAGQPPEERGLPRDAVRLMVSRQENDISHAQFHDLGDFLDPGDVLVINTSRTLNAALCGHRSKGRDVEVHLSTQLPGDLWVVELRAPSSEGSRPMLDARAGERVALEGGGSVHLLAPYRAEQRGSADTEVRLWITTLRTPGDLYSYLDSTGFPIRYGYVEREWPLDYYQTVYATEPGSAEMPSAGRAFSEALITRLVAQGIRFAPLVLHTGVASLEDHEPPYAEYFRVPAATASIVNEARAQGRRVIAVGTTAVRALETVAEEDGSVHAGEGWTELLVRPSNPLRAVTGLLTGLHEPRATHLSMLLALAGPDHICATYAQALDQGYLWHEFGDLHLLLP